MIITRTPFRISLFGGGTDHPHWYKNHGNGAVLGFALNKYCWITIRKLPQFFEYKHRIVYSRFEAVKQISEITHPVVRSVLGSLNGLGDNDGYEVHHDGEVPARAGLGSSSSFAVGFLNAINALHGVRRSPHELACGAIYLEQEVLKETVGCQDQVWSAFGGLNRIEFEPEEFAIKTLGLSQERTQDFLNHIVILFTGFQRTATDVEAQKIANFNSKTKQLKRMYELVGEAEQILQDENAPIIDIGALLGESWAMKKDLAESGVVSNPWLDDIYNRGLWAGAEGGKLLGAGSGGFFLFIIRPELKSNLYRALPGLVEIPVGIDWEGSTVIYPVNLKEV